MLKYALILLKWLLIQKPMIVMLDNNDGVFGKVIPGIDSSCQVYAFAVFALQPHLWSYYLLQENCQMSTQKGLAQYHMSSDKWRPTLH